MFGNEEESAAWSAVRSLEDAAASLAGARANGWNGAAADAAEERLIQIEALLSDATDRVRTLAVLIAQRDQIMELVLVT